MDSNQNKSSLSNQENLMPFSQIEKLFQMMNPNFNLAQALAAVTALPPPAETPIFIPTTTPSDSLATLASEPQAEPIENNPTARVGGGEGDERAGVAPNVVNQDEALTDAENVERVRSRMASEDIEKPADASTMEEVMAEIQAEIREGKTPTVEGRVETGVVQEDVFELSDTDDDGVRPITMNEAQILSASRLRRKQLMDESDDEVQPPRVADKVQEVAAEPTKILADEPDDEEEEEDDGDLRLRPEAQRRQTEQIAQSPPAAELERRKKGKQPSLPPRKKLKNPLPR